MNGPPDTPLPCFACGAALESVHDHGDEWVPYAGTMFDSGVGHYGSTVWDRMTSGQSLMVNLCDSCLTEHADRVRVVTDHSPRPKLTFASWDPEADWR